MSNGIEKRRQQLRGGRSVRQVSRDQHTLDVRDGLDYVKIRNRSSWARNPAATPQRIDWRREQDA